MFRKLFGIISAALMIALAFPVSAQNAQNLPLRGINLAGAGFAGQVLPGRNGTNYFFPRPEDVQIYAAFGMKVLRLSFLWERMQPVLYMPFDPKHLELADKVVKEAAAHKIYIIIDLHNSGSYRKQLIGSDKLSVAAFNDFWTRMAEHYKDEPYVVFGLMNEPHKHSASEWAEIAQEGVNAIRKTGAKQIILVPGTNWSAAHKWLNRDGWISNGDALKKIKDPENNIVFEAHIYFDKDTSGTHPDCVSETIGAERLVSFTGWLRQNGFRGFLGEFGSSQDPVCLAALKNTLSYMDQNKDVWWGWTIWAASPAFGNYYFNIYPPNPEKLPQAKIIKEFIDAAR
ncbi:MAG: glycoside hydrolase family 5 protein [Bdellovibrionales bacterium]